MGIVDRVIGGSGWSGRGRPRARRWVATGVATVAVSLAVASPASADTLTWTAASTPSPAAVVNDLYGVSCASATTCMAVGTRGTGRHETGTLAEAENGTSWSVVHTPSPGRGYGAQLNGVSCVSATDCTAVGFYVTTRGNYKTLVESWDGTSWSVVPSLSPFQFSTLYGVSCLSATACIAVGDTSRRSISSDRSLIESWNGTSWSVVPSPRAGGHLNSVSCVSANACTAVGSGGGGSGNGGLIESWNGTRWSIAPDSSPGTRGYLYGVSCVSANACVATGMYAEPGHGYLTLVQSWDGTSWSVVPSPNPGHGDDDALVDASCLSATDCTAVGTFDGYGPQAPIKTLVESWDGTAWSVVPSPSHSTSVSWLGSVSCVSATMCTAAGYRENPKSHDRSLIETGSASQ
jgi:hypothetical protein